MKTKSIKKKILSTAFILTLFAVAFPTFVTSNQFSHNLEKENEQQSIEAFRQSEARMLELLDNVYNTAMTLWPQESISDYFLQNHVAEKEDVLARISVVQEIKKIVKSSSDVAAVIFIDSNGKQAGSSRDMRYFSNSNNYAFYDQLLSLNIGYETKWLGLVDSNLLLSEQTPKNIDTHLICGIRKHAYTISKIPDQQSIYILFAIRDTSLLACFSHLEYEDNRVFLLDEYGRTLCGSYPVGAIPTFFGELGENESGSFIYQDADNNQSQIIFYRIANTGWTLVNSIPTDIYTKNITSMWQISFLVGAITLLLVCILYSLWAKNFCIPLTNLTLSIQDLKSGNLDSRVPLAENYSTEMYLVCEQFNELLDNMNQLLIQKEWNERERAALEIKTLQSQITPHFIYNTITSIRYMAFASGARNVEDALITFSNIIRPIFSTWQSDWQLHEELEFIGNYISLMRMRFGELINIDIHTDERANMCRIPRFVLQTLLENSCEHGFDGSSVLNIALSANTHNDILFIEIVDDGLGIPEKKLSEIQYNIQNGIWSSSIGLTNLDRRIKLFCGNDCGLNIVSTCRQGTKVVVRIRIIQ